MRREEQRRAAEQRDRNDVLRIVGELLEQRGLVEIMLPSVTTKRIAVRRRAQQRAHGRRGAAAGRFSTTTDWPTRSCKCWAVMRATVSGSPPAAYGTMKRMPWLG